MSLENKVAIVTGSSSGIGRAIALELASQGAAVLINFHKGEEEAHAVKAECEAAGGRAHVVGADVSVVADIQRLIDEMLMIRPPPPCLIICFAASWTPKKALFRSTAMTMSNWRSVVSRVDVRVSIPALLTRMSSRPKAATVPSTSLPMSATLDTSAWITCALPPASSISLSVASAASAFL